jgi:hypothetical protein
MTHKGNDKSHSPSVPENAHGYHNTGLEEELEDDLEAVISDSFDVDWQARTGARAVIAWLKENGRLIVRAELMALLKAAHEVVDETGETADGSKFYWEVSRESIEALQAATLPYQDRIDLFTLDFEAIGEIARKRLESPAQHAEIADTFTSDEAADRRDAPATIEQPSTHGLGGIPALLHRLAIMARVADDQERRGDAFSAREAARVIGELQSHVTRLTVRGEEHPVEEFDPLPLEGQ